MSNDFNSLVEKYKKKQPANNFGIDRSGTVTVKESDEDEDFFKLVDKYSKKETEKKTQKFNSTVSHRLDRIRNQKSEEDDSRLDFFQKGAFKDGYQRGDVIKTILGTTGDAGLNAVKGIAGIGESIGDLAVYGIAGIADLVGKDEYADDARKRAQVNQIDKITKGAEDYLNQYSVLGRSSDAILQGVGQVGAIVATGGIGAAAGLGSGGVTALTTGMMGLSGMGSGMGEAYQNNATDLEALKHGLNTGAADALSELIFGGLGKAVNALGFSRGLSNADDMLAKLVGSKFKHQAAKNIVEFGIKSGAEGLEEVISGVAQAYSKYNTYLKDQGVDFVDVLKDENLLEQFLVGSFTSGIAQAPSLHVANTSKTDFITGQTQSEQAVIKKEIEKRIANAEKDGNKLTAKEKSNIEAQVERALERGYISTDTIEEVLGGKAYSAYDSLVKESEEFKTLYETEGGKLSEKQRDRLAELKAKNQKTSYESAIKEAKMNLFREGFNKSQNSRLAESYNELVRKTKNFEADLSKYKSESAKKTVQNIIDSGLANNSNEFHDFVDLLTNISEGRGTVFHITNNEQLKGTEHYKEGFITDGFITTDDGSITINMDSPKALNFITGHEVTHSLEKSNFYADLQKAVYQYAEDKGELEKYKSSVDSRYGSLDDVGRAKEVTADLIGRYLFTDYDFISNLSANHRNVFQKVYDEIKHLCKMATAGSKAARDLERVKHQFEKALRENVKAEQQTQSQNNADVNANEATIDPENDSDLDYESPTKYSVTVKDPETIDFLENQEHITTYKAMILVDGKLYPPMASKVKGEDGKYHMTNPRELGEWMQAEEDTTNIKFNDKGIGYYDLKKDDGGTVRAAYNPYEHSSNLVLNDQFEAAYKRGNLVTVECVVPKSEMTSGYKAEHAKDSTGMMDWHSGVVAGKLTDNKRSVYLSRYLKAVRIVPDSEVAQKYKEIVGDLAVPFNVVSPSLLTELENVGVNIDYDGSPQYQYLQRRASEKANNKGVEAKYSLSANAKTDLHNALYDTKYRSEVLLRDESPAIMVSQKGVKNLPMAMNASHIRENVFTEAEAKKLGLKVDDYTHYHGLGEDFFLKVIDGLDNVQLAYRGTKNATDPSRRENYFLLVSEFKDQDGNTVNVPVYIDEHAQVNRVFIDVNKISTVFGRDEFQDYINRQIKKGDLVRIKNRDIKTSERDTLIVPGYGKDASSKENIPQDKQKVNHSFSKDTQGNDLTAEQSEFFKDSKVVDENGNLKVMYHGTPNGDFTIFKDGTYFTDNKEYADRYQNPSASSISSGKTATNPKTFEVYLDIKKPFDINDAEARNIYINEYIKGGNAMGINPYLSDAEYEKIKTIDWTEGEDLRDFLIENGYDYDGLVLDEGADGGYGDDVKSRGTSWVVFSPEQVKNVDNAKPTSNHDIRYSMSEAVDNEGNQLTIAQTEFFKDSKIRDRDGNLRRVYHTTQNDFTVFDKSRKGEATDGPNTFLGFFFAESPNHMTQFPEFQNGKTDSYYLDMKKPMDLTDLSKEAFMDIVELTGGDRFEAAEAYDEELEAEQGRARFRGDNNTSLSISQLLYNMVGDYYHVDFFDALKPNYDKLIAKGYDGVIDYLDEMMGEREFVVFDSNQAKLTSNTNPTSDPDIRHSVTGDEGYEEYGSYNVYGKDAKIQSADDIPIAEQSRESATVDENATVETPPVEDDEIPIKTVKERLTAKRSNSQTELDNNRKLREEATKSFGEKIAKAQAQLDSKKNKDTKVANNLRRRIERLQRLKADVDAQYAKRISDIESRLSKTDAELQKDHTKQDQYERTIARINRIFEMDKADLDTEFAQKRELIADKNTYISEKASELYKEIRGLKKGVKASEQLGYLLDHGYDWSSIRSALVNIKHTPGETVNINSEVESVAREMLNDDFEQAHYTLDSEYQSRLSDLETDAETKRQSAKVANQRMVKHQEYADQMEELIGDTTTWVDKKMGISYKVNTLKRNLRDIIRDAQGNRDIAKADAIYDELQGKYNHNEAMLHREANQIKSPYADLKITDAEDKYIQMLGELRHNPDTTLTEDAVNEFYEKHKNKIDTAKVDKVIESARETYDTLLQRVNEVLREQGMKEIPYRQGYFPHFTDPKQSWLAKLLNWKVKDFDIPTDIAGLTENFNPNRSWQAFNKQRKGDTTDYSFKKGLDTYVQGALDWIYHIEDIQKRRAFENHIRYVHSDKGVQEKIEAIRKNTEYDADEMQEQIDLVYKEAGNPLNNFVTDFRSGTNTLANKKSSLDRGMEELVNRKVYSTMTNLSNRVTANMVVGSVSSALTNFIPITQSWVEVSPVSSLRAMGDTIKSTVRDDGMIDKSDFLTNRLRQSEALYKTGWDKVSDKAALMMEAIDSFTSQTVWRSKYLENISKGMSESEAIKNADQFAENVIAGRSRGNMPTIFDSKNPLIKTLTAFQLEVNNQYQYMFKDAPQDMKDKSVAKLVKGYATAFLGAYAYNALYSSLVGRDAAFDPIGIIEELFKDIFGDDDDEEPADIVLGLTDNILEEVPFVGGLLGGGRIPISSALPYDGLYEAFKGTVEDVSEGDWKGLTKEWMNPLYYMAMPLGGGQIRKTVQGLGMFDDDLPVSGSYTDSGKLRFPVEDTIGNKVKAGLFGQYASQNARDYFDSGRSPMGEKQIKEYDALDIPIRDYWEYQDTAKKLAEEAKKDNATDETILKSKYLNSVNDELSDLLAEERKVTENASLTEKQKQTLISDIQRRFDALAKERYDSYDTVTLKGDYAVVGDRYYQWYTPEEGEPYWRKLTDAQKTKYIVTSSAGNANYATDGNVHYRRDENGEWTKISDKQLARQNEVTKALGITPEEYWSETDISFFPTTEGEYEYAFDNPSKYAVSKAVAKDFNEYNRLKDEINIIKENNDSDSGIQDKTLVSQYIFGLDIDEGQKMILYRSLYGSKADKAQYNKAIVEYLNSRNDLSREDKVSILEELDMTADSEGNVWW